jgi:hypothetical protein
MPLRGETAQHRAKPCPLIFLRKERSLVWALIHRQINLKGSPWLPLRFGVCFPLKPALSISFAKAPWQAWKTRRCVLKNPDLAVENAGRQIAFCPCMMHGAITDLPDRFAGQFRHGGQEMSLFLGRGPSGETGHRTRRLYHPASEPLEDRALMSSSLGGFRVALDMAFGALSKYDFCFVGMGFPEVGSLGMEANGVGSKRILESADQAKSPRRILVRSLLKSRNKLREKYRELRAECKRWRNQAAAVERSRSTWRERALAHEASAQEDRAARAKLESQRQQLREQSERRELESAELRARLAALEGAEKKG